MQPGEGPGDDGSENSATPESEEEESAPLRLPMHARKILKELRKYLLEEHAHMPALSLRPRVQLAEEARQILILFEDEQRNKFPKDKTNLRVSVRNRSGKDKPRLEIYV